MRQQPQREFTIVDLARAFDVAAHTAINQKRKYTGEDYHVHPEEVLSILLTYCDPPPEVQAATLLHDVIEDTATTREHIARVFGQYVAQLVVEVSDVSKASDGTRKTRKALDREHLAKASLWGKRLKCADLISNSRSIAQYDIKFGQVYLEEKLAILRDFYEECVDESVFRKAMAVCGEAFLKVYPEQATREKVMKRLLKDDPDLFCKLLWGTL